jgi:hypothetical protein
MPGYTLHRKAIAMIELIFAIVIMGLALMSAPMLISQASMGGLAAVQQEAIVAASTELGMIMTRHWDEADTDESDYGPILVVNEDISALNEAVVDGNKTGKRIGIPAPSSRSFLTSDGSRLNASATLNNEDGDFDDIDDFNGKHTTLTVAAGDSTTTAVGDYIDTSLQMDTSVSYLPAPDISYAATTISFNDPFSSTSANSSNIKSISTTVTSGSHDSELGTNITLRAFMCNIGTYILKRRTF